MIPELGHFALILAGWSAAVAVFSASLARDMRARVLSVMGMIAVGEMRADGSFRATQVLAKHDENYMPPEVHEALKAGQTLDEASSGGRGDGR